MIPAWLRDRLALPVGAAPMLLVSGPDLVVAAWRAGVLGSFPTANCWTPHELERWLSTIDAALGNGAPSAPFAANLIVHRSNTRLPEDLALVVRYEVPIVIASVVAPDAVIDAVHGYRGLVVADVATLRHPRRAIAAGVDGLVLLTSGAGGQEGSANPFAFVRAARDFYDGLVMLAGCLADGIAIRAAEVLGADLAYVGTPFIAAEESLAPDEYRHMLARATMDDVVRIAAITGLSANFLKESLAAAGLDVERLARGAAGDLAAHVADGLDQARWKRLWAAGQGVGAVRATEPAAHIVERLRHEYLAVCDAQPPSPMTSRDAPGGPR